MGRPGGSAIQELSGLQFYNQRKRGEGEKSLFLLEGIGGSAPPDLQGELN